MKIVNAGEIMAAVWIMGEGQIIVDQNNDLRKIAPWAAIAAVQTSIAGVYGMNFRFMPELGTRYGYPAVLTLMLVSAVVLYRLFRRSGWL